MCYSLVAAGEQISTTGVPAYIRVEDAIIGVVDTQNPANVEFADNRISHDVGCSTSIMLTTHSSSAILQIPRSVSPYHAMKSILVPEI